MELILERVTAIVYVGDFVVVDVSHHEGDSCLISVVLAFYLQLAVTRWVHNVELDAILLSHISQTTLILYNNNK